MIWVFVNLKECKRWQSIAKWRWWAEEGGVASSVAWRMELHTRTMIEHAPKNNMKRREHKEQTGIKHQLCKCKAFFYYFFEKSKLKIKAESERGSIVSLGGPTLKCKPNRLGSHHVLASSAQTPKYPWYVLCPYTPHDPSLPIYLTLRLLLSLPYLLHKYHHHPPILPSPPSPFTSNSYLSLPFTLSHHSSQTPNGH